MIDGSCTSLTSSVLSMNNSSSEIQDLFNFNEFDLFETSLNNYERDFQDCLDSTELEDSEECDSLFNFDLDSENLNNLLNLQETCFSSLQTNYLCGIESDSLNLPWESVSSAQTDLSNSLDFEMVDVCQSNSRESEHKHWNDIVNYQIKWSHLTSNEQASVIWSLAQYLINLSPRERGDILKILKPDFKLSQFDSLTLFDSNLFTDGKFELIQNYLKSHRPSYQCKSTPKINTKKKSQKRKVSKMVDPRTKKVEQAVKEKKSGLFKKEIVVSLSTNELDDENKDIDILG